MAHQYPQAGRCIQQVTQQVWNTESPTTQSSYNYVNIPNSNNIVVTGTTLFFL